MCTKVSYVHMDLKGQKTTWMQSLSCHLPNQFWMFPEQEPNSYWKDWQSKRRQRIQRIELLRKIFWKRECLLWFAEHLFLNNSGCSLQNLSECVLMVHGSVKALVPMQIPLPLPSESSRRCVVFTSIQQHTHFFRDLSLCSTPISLALLLSLIFFSIHLSFLCRGGIRPQEKRLICAVSTAHQTIPPNTQTHATTL